MPLVKTANTNERHQPQNPNKLHRDSLSINDKIALTATRAFGSMPMFYLFFAWALLPIIPFFSQYQTFILYVSAGIIQLVALPLISVGQNLQGRHSEIRAEEEFKTTKTSYNDIENILKHLDAQDEELIRQSKMIQEILLRIEGKSK